MSSEHWSVHPGALFVLGRTQTGKTTTARELHAESDRISIWLNERGKSRVPNVAGKRVRSLRGLKSGLADDVWKFNWLSSDREADLQTLTDWAWRVADRTDRSARIQIVADEIHRLAPQSQQDTLPGRDAIRTIAKEGQKRNIKLVGITQDPVSMDKQSLRQREFLAIYGLSSEQASYLTDYGVDVEIIRSQSEFAGVVYHADGSEIATGVKARGRYA